MEQCIPIPASMRPDENYGRLSVFNLTKIGKTAGDFAKEFGIERENALLSALAGLAHAIGGMVRTSTTFASIEPPFSLLLITPEAEPVWTEVPVRFLTHEFNASMRQSLEWYLNQRAMEGCKKGEDPSDTSLKDAADLAKRLYMDGMVERISTSSVLFPFPRSLIDNHVLLSTPPVGIRRALQQLEPLQKYRLENALSTATRLVAPDGVRSSGVPSFYWQVSKAELPQLLIENPWLIGVPFLAIEAATPGKAQLNSSASCVLDLLNHCRELVAKRHAIMGNSRPIQIDDKSYRPCASFLEEAQRDESLAGVGTMLSPRRIVELGLKFTSILTVLNDKRQAELLEVILGLELAKRAARRRHRILQDALSEGDEQLEQHREGHLEGLSIRERSVFLRIVEKDGLTKTELSRSFNRMRSEERDKIIANLYSRKLLKFEDGKLLPSVA
jgi:hypothetical protein